MHHIEIHYVNGGYSHQRTIVVQLGYVIMMLCSAVDISWGTKDETKNSLEREIVREREKALWTG